MSRMEALEAAYDAMEAEESPAEPAPEVAPSEESVPEPVSGSAVPDTAEVAPQSGRARGPDGKFIPKDSASSAKPEGAPAKTEPVKATESAPVASPVKPPQSWKPAARELAARLPAEFHPLLEEVNRREKETAIALQRAAEVSRAHQGFQESIRPYEALIRQSGAAPEQYVGSLLQAAHSLSYGQPAQRADALAGIVAQFAADLLRPDRQNEDGSPSSPLDRALVARLSGQQARAPAQQAPPQEFRDPRFDAFLEQAQARVAQQAQTKAQELMESHEFLADVKDDVADILELWGKRGNTNPSDADLERAYTIACQQHPEIKAILDRREQAKALGTASATTQRARAAGSSLRSNPTAAPEAQPQDRRAALEAAYDRIVSR